MSVDSDKLASSLTETSEAAEQRLDEENKEDGEMDIS